MSAALALLFLAEATAACAPAAPARLGGGAEAVRAVLEFQDEAPDPPVPTPAALGQPIRAAADDSELVTNETEFDPAPAQCSLAPLQIA